MKTPEPKKSHFFLPAFLLPLSMLAQGSLTPPGAPGPTMLTLSQVEPRTPIGGMPFSITNSGSYYLTTNYSGAAGAIVILTNNVALDLNGFTLAGNGSNYGIYVNQSWTNITVRNGILQNWNVALYAALADNCQFEHLFISHNAGGVAGGTTTLVSDCTASGNGQDGIQVSEGCKIVNCISRLNGGSGITTGAGASVIGCVAELNALNGINMDHGLVKDCVARQNTNNGISAFSYCVVLNNNCPNNKIAGIISGQGGHRIEGNTVEANGFGINCNPSTGNLIIRNSATGNVTNYNVAASNTTGPVITSSTIATNTNPDANFSY